MSLRHEKAILRRTLTIVAEALEKSGSVNEQAGDSSKPQEESSDLGAAHSLSGGKSDDAKLARTKPDDRTGDRPDSAPDRSSQLVGQEINEFKAAGSPPRANVATGNDTAETPPSETSLEPTVQTPGDSTLGPSDVEESAVDWMQRVPWENPEDVQGNLGDRRAKFADASEDATPGIEGSAAEFLSDLPWGGEGKDRGHEGAVDDADESDADAEPEDNQSASAFLGNLNWSGNSSEEKKEQDAAEKPESTAPSRRENDDQSEFRGRSTSPREENP